MGFLSRFPLEGLAASDEYMGQQDKDGKKPCYMSLFSFRDESRANLQIMQSICTQVFLAKLGFGMDQ